MRRSTTGPGDGLLEFVLCAVGAAVLLIPFVGYGPLVAILLQLGLTVVMIDRLLARMG